MPHLVRFLIRHALMGFTLGILFVGALLAFDVARLGSLIWASSSGLIAALALTFSVGITFASVQMGFAVMLLSDHDEGPKGGHRGRVPRLVPARVRAPALRERTPSGRGGPVGR